MLQVNDVMRQDAGDVVGIDADCLLESAHVVELC